jgi:phosphoribosylanthranilate isomerase
MNRGTIKLCSLREPRQAQFVVEAGADLFGLIFAPARRQVTLERAAEIVQKLREDSCNKAPGAVGVFVDEDVVELNNIAEIIDLTFVQLHGDESPEYVAHVRAPAIKAIRPMPGDTFNEIARRIEAFQRVSRPPVAYLIEGFHPQQAGGHGGVADWETARLLAARFPIILAGGLAPENIADAIEAVEPLGVDVSSGVETNGLKDREKMIEFVARAQLAFMKVEI